MISSILIADDEDDVRHLVAIHLQRAGFKVLQAEEGQTAVALVLQEHPDLVVLDVNMPRMSGLEVCRMLKSDPLSARTAIVMLTAKGEELDRIVGLELGADDYITKPFSPREMVLRIKAVLRRKNPVEPQSLIQIGPISIDPLRHEVRLGESLLDLTATEFKLLVLLAERRGRVQSREALLKEVWSYETAIDTRTVDTHVRRLREKLGPGASYIETIRGFGYRIGA